MADVVPSTEAATAAAETLKHNAEVAAKQAAQDLAGRPPLTNEFEDVTSALDKLAQAVPDPEVVAKEAAAKEAADKAAAEAAAKAAETPEAKAAAEAAAKAEADEAAAKAKADELFKEVQLPSDVKPKSAEAFAQIKAQAAKEISAREAELEKVRTQLKELEQKANTPNPEQAQKEKELEELRQWRAKLDVDFDPKFKSFDKQINDANEFIYAQLRQSPAVNEKVIDDIKKYGGPDKINLAKLFETINDPTLQRLVEAKNADVAMLRYNKEQQIKAAKENLDTYLKERQEQFVGAASQHNEMTKQELNKLLGSLPWYAEKKADEKADEAARKSVEEHNTFIADLRGQVNAAMSDDSPQMRAILVTGMAQLFRLQREHAGVAAERDALKKELADVRGKFDKVKQAGLSRLRESAAPASGALPAAKPMNQFTTPATDALDALARQVTEERAAKGV